MADANGLVEAMKRAARDERESSKPVNVYFGAVISKSPLKINVEQKMVLGQNQLVLTRNVTDFGTQIDGRKVTIQNGLNAGDEVVLVRQQEGQKFIVIDRIGGK